MHPFQPHVVKVRTVPFRDVVDGRPHACDENVVVMVIGVKLELSPTHCVEKDCRQTGLEMEGGHVCHGHTEVGFGRVSLE